MEVSGQLHAPAALPPGIEPLVGDTKTTQRFGVNYPIRCVLRKPGYNWIVEILLLSRCQVIVLQCAIASLPVRFIHLTQAEKYCFFSAFSESQMNCHSWPADCLNGNIRSFLSSSWQVMQPFSDMRYDGFRSTVQLTIRNTNPILIRP
jgi:hypothetical protein